MTCQANKRRRRGNDKILKCTFGSNSMPWIWTELAVCTHCEVLHANCEKMKNIIIDMKLRAGVKNKLWAEVLELLKYIYFDIWHIRSLPCSRTHSSLKWNAASSRWRISAINSPKRFYARKYRCGWERGEGKLARRILFSFPCAALVRRTQNDNSNKNMNFNPDPTKFHSANRTRVAATIVVHSIRSSSLIGEISFNSSFKILILASYMHECNGIISSIVDSERVKRKLDEENKK